MNRRLKRTLIFLNCFLSLPFLSARVSAQENADLRPALAPIRPVENAPLLKNANAGDASFSLEYFLLLVEKNYPKLLSADAERRIAGAKRLEKAGAFDPVITHLSEFLRVQDTFKPGVAKDALHNESRVDLLSRSGIKVFAGARLNPNDTKTPFVPTGKSGEYVAGVTVPLMRGLKVNEKSTAEAQAKLGEPLAAQVYGGTRLEVLLKAAATYYDWVGAKARLEVARNLLNIAKARVEQVERRVKKGDAPALELAESEQEIQRREAGLVKTERELQKAAFALSIYFWDEKGEARSLPPVEAIPALSPEPKLVSEEERLAARKNALDLRPELKKIQLEKQQAQLDLRLAENMILPAMDAYFVQGADTGPDGIGPVVRAGMAVSYPLRQRTARGQVQTARLKIEKLNLDEKAERMRIQTEVDDTVSAMNAAYQRYLSTELELRKARAVEAGERSRYAQGDSTLFLVNQRERTTAEAQMRLLETHVEYLQALAAFRAVSCRL